MKSEHRHELQTNSLASTLTNLPELLRRHSSKIMTGLAIVLLIVAVMKYRRDQAATRDQDVRLALASAWNTFNALQRMSLQSDVPQRAKMIQDSEADIKAAVQRVLDEADPTTDRARLAGAYQVTGDLYWTLANDPQRLAATTQPAGSSTTQPSTQAVTVSPNEYLDRATAAYQRILKDYADQTIPATVARFSLAAIAENQGNWTQAREQYKALIESPATPPANKALAETRIVMLDDLQKPLLLLPPQEPAPSVDLNALKDGLNLPQFDQSLKFSNPAPTTAPTTQP